MFSDGLVFRASSTEQLVFLILGAAAVLLVLWAHHWRRSLWSALALLSKLGALGVLLFLLLKPELKKEIKLDQEPSLLILNDSSPSMQTQDVLDGQEIVTRTQARERFMESEEWKAFEAATPMMVQQRSFANDDTKTDLSAALEEAKALNPTVILLASDGAWNAGVSPSRIGQEYSLAGTHVFSLVLGADKRMPDLSVSVLESPLIVETDDPFAIKLELRSSFAERVTSRLIVKEGDEVIEDQEVVLEPESKQIVDVIHKVVEGGDYNFSVELSPVVDEVTTENNFLETKVTARKQFIKVLLVDTLPRWEYRFIRNAMIRDEQVEVSCLLLHPTIGAAEGRTYIQSFPESLVEYDVIFLGDIGIGEGQLQAEEISQIAEAVRTRASGLILMPGQKGFQQSLVEHDDFSALFPVEFAGELGGKGVTFPERLKLSSAGEESLLMNLSTERNGNSALWEELPGFTWYQPTARVKAGATVLAYHENAQSDQGSMPLVVTARSGRGKVLYMGIDSSWRWRRGVEDLYHYRFWRQMARWMSYQRNLTDGEQAQLFLSSDVAKEGHEVRLSLVAMTASGQPAKPEAVKVMVSLPDGNQRILPISAKDGWGEYGGRLSVDQAGDYKVEVVINEATVATRSLEVTPAALEGVGEPADTQTLSDLAQLTRAISVRYDDRLDLLEYLEQAANPPTRYQFIPFAHQWSWFVAMLLLIVASWIFRRMSGAE